MPFGPKQFNNPTPRSKSIMMDFFVGLSGIVSGFITSASFIPHGLSDPLSSIISSLVIPTLLLMKRMFGEEIDKAKFDIDDVTEIKDK